MESVADQGLQYSADVVSYFALLVLFAVVAVVETTFVAEVAFHFPSVQLELFVFHERDQNLSHHQLLYLNQILYDSELPLR